MRRGHGSPPVLSEVFSSLASVVHSKERERSPQQFILAGFPSAINRHRGTKDSFTNPYSVFRPLLRRPHFSTNILIFSVKLYIIKIRR